MMKALLAMKPGNNRQLSGVAWHQICLTLPCDNTANLSLGTRVMSLKKQYLKTRAVCKVTFRINKPAEWEADGDATNGVDGETFIVRV